MSVTVNPLMPIAENVLHAVTASKCHERNETLGVQRNGAMCEYRTALEQNNPGKPYFSSLIVLIEPVV